jgi:signal transduction histidine kinase
MSPEVLEKIFDPFFSKSTQGGTGLGMLVVSNVISAHQGVLTVDSVEGRRNHGHHPNAQDPGDAMRTFFSLIL